MPGQDERWVIKGNTDASYDAKRETKCMPETKKEDNK